MSSGQSMIFRRLNENDSDSLSKMLYSLPACEQQYFRPHGYDVDTLKQLVHKKRDRYFILLVNDTVAGYSMLRFFKGYSNPMFGICIYPSYHGLGFGSLLTRLTLNEAKTMGSTVVRLHVDSGNVKAYLLYVRCGFQVIAEDESIYFMEKKL